MAARPQCRNHGCRRVGFKHHPWAGLDPETRCIDSRLRVTAQIDQLLHHLDMALRLHISAHNAKTGKRLVLAGDEGWNNGMHGALAGTHLVPMPRRQRKTATAVVQSYACSGYDDTGSEALEIGR